MKHCPKCDETKTLDAFHNNKRNKDGKSNWCKICNNKNTRAAYVPHPWPKLPRVQIHNPEHTHAYFERQRTRTPEQVAEDRKRLRPEGVKTCRVCRQSLVLELFGKSSRSPDGLRAECRDCRSSHRRLSKIGNFTARGLTQCVYCGGPKEHADHVISVYLGGRDVETNLVPACAKCNLRKNKRTIWEWLDMCRPGEDHKALLRAWGIVWD